VSRAGRRLSRLLMLPSLVSALALVGCEARERPTGPVPDLEAVDVNVLEPQEDALVGADSMSVVVVQAIGGVIAIEFVLTRDAEPDTFARERLEFGTTQSGISARFDVRIPDLVSGSSLVVRGLAEDRSGQFYFSDPVVVQVIECDLFPGECSQN
jgi:hypothetical protein